MMHDKKTNMNFLKKIQQNLWTFEWPYVDLIFKSPIILINFLGWLAFFFSLHMYVLKKCIVGILLTKEISIH
jgi:hypothetical protein